MWKLKLENHDCQDEIFFKKNKGYNSSNSTKATCSSEISTRDYNIHISIIDHTAL